MGLFTDAQQMDLWSALHEHDLGDTLNFTHQARP